MPIDDSMYRYSIAWAIDNLRQLSVINKIGTKPLLVKGGGTQSAAGRYGTRQEWHTLAFVCGNIECVLGKVYARFGIF